MLKLQLLQQVKPLRPSTHIHFCFIQVYKVVPSYVLAVNLQHTTFTADH